VYWRADREFSVSLPDRRYERVAQLFALTLERLDDKSVPDPLQDAARELGEQLGATGGRGAPGKRLTAALKAGGYEPATVEAGVIRLRNCPFAALADAHRPLVCGMNLALAEGIIRGSGATTVRPILDFQPDLCCVAFVPDTDRPA
jgi:predicted ArsR family transcriptional regulator